MNYNFKKTDTGIFPYNREAAYRYAKRWAFDRSPKYYDFSQIGGNCTNFASQVLYAGGCPMNYARWTGWYYTDVNNRAPAWTGVEYLYRFLINNKERGPIARLCDIEELEVGDIIQLDLVKGEEFNHTPVVVRIEHPISPDNIFIAANSKDRFDYRLSNYYYTNIRFIHIEGYKY